MKEEQIAAALRVKSADKEHVLEWINEKITRCSIETEMAEAIALTGIVEGSTVDDVFANFTQCREKIHYHAAMIDAVMAKYGYAIPDEYRNMKAILRELLKRLTSAGNIVEVARNAARKPSFPDLF